jgi:hypothetical protein
VIHIYSSSEKICDWLVGGGGSKVAKGVQLMLEGVHIGKSIPTDIKNPGAQPRCSVFSRITRKKNGLKHRNNKKPILN